MGIHTMLLNYVRTTGDLLAALTITIAIEKAAKDWNNQDIAMYVTEVTTKLHEIHAELRKD